jgi:hypothetical protein
VNEGSEHSASVTPSSSWWAWRLAGVGVVLAVLVVALERGSRHPDEIFQYLEPAHGLAFGSWVKAWEWEVGLRNWAVPGVLGGVLVLCGRLGLEHPWALATAVWLFCALLQAGGTVAFFRLVEERDGSSAALLATALYVTWGGWLLFAARSLGDSLSVAPLLGAWLWAWRGRARDSLHAGVWCGALLGLAFVVRYPSALFGLPIAVSLLGARRWRSLAGAVLGGTGVLLALGLLDAWTWGAPWHSLWKYFEFNILQRGSERFGVRPAWWYLPTLAGMVPLLLSWHFARGLARRELLGGSFVFYFAAMSALAHKEVRFLVPLLPLFFLLAAGPLRDSLRRVHSRRVLGGLAGLYGVSSLLAATVQMPGSSREPTDALVFTGRLPSLTGLLVAGPMEFSTCGRFHLHRDVPLLIRPRQWVEDLSGPLTDARYSHALVMEDTLAPRTLEAAGFCVMHRWKRTVLWRRCST